jgi:hypothetical protein
MPFVLRLRSPEPRLVNIFRSSSGLFDVLPATAHFSDDPAPLALLALASLTLAQPAPRRLYPEMIE